MAGGALSLHAGANWPECGGNARGVDASLARLQIYLCTVRMLLGLGWKEASGDYFTIMNETVIA
jgi:hypothetical protein